MKLYSSGYNLLARLFWCFLRCIYAAKKNGRSLIALHCGRPVVFQSRHNGGLHNFPHGFSPDVILARLDSGVRWGVSEVSSGAPRLLS